MEIPYDKPLMKTIFPGNSAIMKLSPNPSANESNVNYSPDTAPSGPSGEAPLRH